MQKYQTALLFDLNTFMFNSASGVTYNLANKISIFLYLVQFCAKMSEILVV